jgi:hypothetical protein
MYMTNQEFINLFIRYVVVTLAFLLASVNAFAPDDSVLSYGVVAQDELDSILNYGVVAGSCGDATAISANNLSIQAALDSGNNIYFPPGNYPFTALGFNISTSGQHVHGAACTGTGTAAPYCPSSIQDCSATDLWPDACDSTWNCGYLSVRASHVEINDLKIQGNTLKGTSLGGTTHKGIYGNGNGNDNLYVHDMYVTETNGESIYSDASGANTRFIRNTVTNVSSNGLNTNNFDMTNVLIADNIVINASSGCVVVASGDAYVLRNTCQGGASGGGAIALVAVTTFHVVAFNTINQWDSGCCAVSPMQTGLFTTIGFNGPGVIAYNTIINNLETHINGRGSAFEIDSVDGPEVVAFNTIKYNGDRGQPSNPGILIHGATTGAVLISNNILDGTANDENIGIQIYYDVPFPNQIQINSSNTFGTIPTPTQYLFAPSGASMDVFQSIIQRALPYLPNGLPVTN